MFVPDSTPSIGNGPDNKGLITLGDQLQPVVTYNRAGFDVVVDVDESTASSGITVTGA